MKTFENLKFQHTEHSVYAHEFFHNGYGIFVIKNSYLFGGDNGLYECAVLKGTKRNYHVNYKTPITGSVIGYCTPEMVTAIMRKIQELCVYY